MEDYVEVSNRTNRQKSSTGRLILWTVGIGFTLAVVLPVLFPRSSPEQLGALACSVTIFVMLLLAVRKSLIGVCAVLLGSGIIFSGALSSSPQRATNDVKAASLQGFDIKETNGAWQLQQKTLGLVVPLPEKFINAPIQKTKPGISAWGFQNQNRDKVLLVIAGQTEVTTAADMQKAMQGYRVGAGKSLTAQKFPLKIVSEKIVWNDTEHYGEMRGNIGYGKFCVRFLPCDAQHQGFCVVVQGIARTEPLACELAQSARLVAPETPAPKR